MAKNQREEQPTSSADVSRRDLFQILGAVPAVAIASETASARPAHKHGHATDHPPEAAKSPYQWKVFDEHQRNTVRVLCDLIIPADERSGSASQAGVPETLDDWLAFRTEQNGNQNFQAEILGGLMWLDHESNRLFQKDFADAEPQQQRQILDRIAYHDKVAKEDRIWARFFNEFRSLTVSNFFSSKMGVADLPYLGNVAVMEWKGCDPKVWAVIEDRMKNGYKGLIDVKPWDKSTAAS